MTKTKLTTKQAIMKVMSKGNVSMTPIKMAKRIKRNPNTVRRCMRELYYKYQLNVPYDDPGTYVMADFVT